MWGWQKGLNIWQYILWELQIHLQATYTSQSSTDCLQSLMLKATSCPRAGVLHPNIVGRGPGSRQERIVQRRAAQQPSKTIKDRTQLQQEYSSRTV